MTVLITGAAGFIGFHLALRLLRRGVDVFTIDNINPYYDRSLKLARLDILKKCAAESSSTFSFYNINLENGDSVDKIFSDHQPVKVVNLAAQAGVRYSLENPSAYINSNIVGFANILEASRNNNVEHLIYASSSSVYGGNTSLPFSEAQSVDHPVSLYAATKKSNELMAHTYSHLFGLPTTGLRFFTVYGPWGRPDMALFIFTKAILSNEPINVYNEGKMIRDFTYIDDIVESLDLLLEKPAVPDQTFDTNSPTLGTSWAPYRIFNIGNSNPVQLMDYIKAIESSLGIKAKINLMPIQPGDVPATAADTNKLKNWIDFRPNTSIEEGVDRFVNWYLSFYNINP